MKIAIVSHSDGKSGGVGAAYRLHKTFRSCGQDSVMLVALKVRGDDSVDGASSFGGMSWAKVRLRLDDLPLKLCSLPVGKVSPAWVPENTAARVNACVPDVVNLHWVNHGYLRPESLRKIHAPIVWTFHDMWAFAGAEHLVGDSTRYIDGYLPSNRMEQESGWDINRWVWQRKRRAWRDMKSLTGIAPSTWMASCAKRSMLFRDRRIEVIPNGVDVARFHPIDRRVARDVLGLSQDKKLILCGAMSARVDKNKGFDLFKEAIASLQGQLSGKDAEIVVFGANEPRTGSEFAIKAHYLGQLNDEISIALVYAAADVFVIPSRQENLPTTVMESLACGTPVVGFDIGGTSDMVTHGETGYLARPYDTAELAAGIKAVLCGDAAGLRQRARDAVLNNFTLQQQVERYLKLFDDIIQKRG